MKLTTNDERVLDAIEEVCTRLDGFIPHGAADWKAIKRLYKAGLIESIGWARCENCELHEQQAFKLVEVEAAITCDRMATEKRG